MPLSPPHLPFIISLLLGSCFPPGTIWQSLSTTSSPQPRTSLDNEPNDRLVKLRVSLRWTSCESSDRLNEVFIDISLFPMNVCNIEFSQEREL